MKNYVLISSIIKKFNKSIHVQGDKSISIRWALMASQAIGKSRAYNLLKSEDVESTLNALKKFDINPKETVFIEDIAKNLQPAKKLGMKTVWLVNNEYWGKKDSDKEFIDYKIKNVSLFLKEIRLLKST